MNPVRSMPLIILKLKNTPLHYACSAGRPVVVRVLLARGASIFWNKVLTSYSPLQSVHLYPHSRLLLSLDLSRSLLNLFRSPLESSDCPRRLEGEEPTGLPHSSSQRSGLPATIPLRSHLLYPPSTFDNIGVDGFNSSQHRPTIVQRVIFTPLLT
jgi:hypothetical protein